MTPQEKAQLFVDLCARYPYGIIVKLDNDKILCVKEINFSNGDYFLTLNSEDKRYIGIDVERIRPFLRPISSMTEEEKLEYKSTFYTYEDELGTKVSYPTYLSTDWLIAHHFDFRGLIKLNLALEATKEMY